MFIWRDRETQTDKLDRGASMDAHVQEKMVAQGPAVKPAGFLGLIDIEQCCRLGVCMP